MHRKAIRAHKAESVLLKGWCASQHQIPISLPSLRHCQQCTCAICAGHSLWFSPTEPILDDDLEEALSPFGQKSEASYENAINYKCRVSADWMWNMWRVGLLYVVFAASLTQHLIYLLLFFHVALFCEFANFACAVMRYSWVHACE